MNWIPRDICDAGRQGGTAAPSVSLPWYCLEHRNSSVPQSRKDPYRCFPEHRSSLCSVTYGSVCNRMLLHKSQPCLSKVARKERKGLCPCAPVTKPMGKRDCSDSSVPTSKYICVHACTHRHLRVYMHRHTGKPASLLLPRRLWI